MIIRKNERVREEAECCMGGIGTTVVHHVVGEDQLRDNGHLFAHVIVHPGESIGTHSHFDECEFYYILKGQAEVDDNGETAVLRSGDVLITRNGEHHALRNVGSVDVEFIALITNEA
jgi:mannose-6-phosphate isomerase-like protein (cupin superfamily)